MFACRMNNESNVKLYILYLLSVIQGHYRARQVIECRTAYGCDHSSRVS